MTYLTSAYSSDDSLYPRDVRSRALVDQRLQFDLGTLYARLADYYVWIRFFSPKRHKYFSLNTKKCSFFHFSTRIKYPTMLYGHPFEENKKIKLNEALHFFDEMLADQTWAAVNHFTLADLSLTVTVAQLESLEFDLKAFVRVCAWLERCKNHLRPFGYNV